jgi:hypothetical protein
VQVIHHDEQAVLVSGATEDINDVIEDVVPTAGLG